MSTYRERREAKADRLRLWADGRDAKADERYTASRHVLDNIPFGQPILVGHHSESGHRAALKRAHGAMDAFCEHTATAQRMRERAENIERQGRQSIYSDDPDAIERLQAKVTALEARQQHMKTANAAYRKEHRAELRDMHPYARSQAIPFPSYALTNLGATLRAAKKRLADLENPRQRPDRTITARFNSECADCGAPLERGTLIRYSRTAGARCMECPTA